MGQVLPLSARLLSYRTVQCLLPIEAVRKIYLHLLLLTQNRQNKSVCCFSNIFALAFPVSLEFHITKPNIIHKQPLQSNRQILSTLPLVSTFSYTYLGVKYKKLVVRIHTTAQEWFNTHTPRDILHADLLLLLFFLVCLFFFWKNREMFYFLYSNTTSH